MKSKSFLGVKVKASVRRLDSGSIPSNTQMGTSSRHPTALQMGISSRNPTAQMEGSNPSIAQMESSSRHSTAQMGGFNPSIAQMGTSSRNPTAQMEGSDPSIAQMESSSRNSTAQIATGRKRGFRFSASSRPRKQARFDFDTQEASEVGLQLQAEDLPPAYDDVERELFERGPPPAYTQCAGEGEVSLEASTEVVAARAVDSGEALQTTSPSVAGALGVVVTAGALVGALLLR